MNETFFLELFKLFLEEVVLFNVAATNDNDGLTNLFTLFLGELTTLEAVVDQTGTRAESDEDSVGGISRHGGGGGFKRAPERRSSGNAGFESGGCETRNDFRDTVADFELVGEVLLVVAVGVLAGLDDGETSKSLRESELDGGVLFKNVEDGEVLAGFDELGVFVSFRSIFSELLESSLFAFVLGGRDEASDGGARGHSVEINDFLEESAESNLLTIEEGAGGTSLGSSFDDFKSIEAEDLEGAINVLTRVLGVNQKNVAGFELATEDIDILFKVEFNSHFTEAGSVVDGSHQIVPCDGSFKPINTATVVGTERFGFGGDDEFNIVNISDGVFTEGVSGGVGDTTLRKGSPEVFLPRTEKSIVTFFREFTGVNRGGDFGRSELLELFGEVLGTSVEVVGVVGVTKTEDGVRHLGKTACEVTVLEGVHELGGVGGNGADTVGRDDEGRCNEVILVGGVGKDLGSFVHVDDDGNEVGVGVGDDTSPAGEGFGLSRLRTIGDEDLGDRDLVFGTLKSGVEDLGGFLVLFTERSELVASVLGSITPATEVEDVVLMKISNHGTNLGSAQAIEARGGKSGLKSLIDGSRGVELGRDLRTKTSRTTEHFLKIGFCCCRFFCLKGDIKLIYLFY